MEISPGICTPLCKTFVREQNYSGNVCMSYVDKLASLCKTRLQNQHISQPMQCQTRTHFKRQSSPPFILLVLVILNHSSVLYLVLSYNLAKRRVRCHVAAESGNTVKESVSRNKYTQIAARFVIAHNYIVRLQVYAPLGQIILRNARTY